MKSDSNTAAIVKSLRALGVDCVYVSSDSEKGVPDICWAFNGRWGWFEMKAPDGNADCGCTAVLAAKCSRPGRGFDVGCDCKGHAGIGNSMRKTRHAQLAWEASHPHMTVTVVRVLEDALRVVYSDSCAVVTKVDQRKKEIEVNYFRAPLPLRCDYPLCEGTRATGRLCTYHEGTVIP
jgi:hypothetical protein